MPCKPAKTYEEQIDILIEKHGLTPGDKERAIQALSSLNYYHLRGYYIHWMDKAQQTFLPDITFEMIIDLHEFDRGLKLLLWPLLLQIELHLRTSIAYYLAHTYEPLAYLNTSIFKNREKAEESKARILEKIEKSSELFVKHYKAKYNGELPIWGVVELLPFGDLSMLFQNLKDSDQTKIASECYNLGGRLLNSYMLSLLCVRNICAHNGRLYNRRLPMPVSISPKNQNVIDTFVSSKFTVYPNNLFAMLFAIKDLAPQKDFTCFLLDLENLISKHSSVVNLFRLGMPWNWKEVLSH